MNRTRTVAAGVPAVLLVALLGGCGGGNTAAPPTVSVAPAAATTSLRGAPLTFSAKVTGVADQSVTWSAWNADTPVPGAISPAGQLQPLTDCALLGATLTIRAQSVAAPAATGSAAVQVRIGAVSPASLVMATGAYAYLVPGDTPCGEQPSDRPASGYQWSVTEGAAGGTVTTGTAALSTYYYGGLAQYTAPAVPGTYHVTLQIRDSTTSATITVKTPLPLTGPMQSCRIAHTATLLQSGMVLLIGDSGNPFGAATCATGATPATTFLLSTQSAELYDPVSRTFSATSPPIYPGNTGHAATLLNDGRVLVTGGAVATCATCPPGGAAPFPSPHAQLYDPASGLFTAAADMAYGHDYHTATLMGDGRVLVYGSYQQTSRPETFDPLAGSFTYAANLGDFSLSFHTATRLPAGQVLIAGSWDTPSTTTTLDPALQSWASTGNLNNPRWGATATLLGNGKVLLVGGVEDGAMFQTSENRSQLSASAELFDPATGRWTPTRGAMLSARAYHAAVLLTNGQVLVVGGVSQTTATASEFDALHPLGLLQMRQYVFQTEIYDPVSDSFSAGPVVLPRVSPTATRLQDGSVLIAGGDSGTGEIY